MFLYPISFYVVENRTSIFNAATPLLVPDSSIYPHMSLEERQQDELSSIESIYGDEFTNITPKGLVWNKKPSPHFQVFLESKVDPNHPTISLKVDIEFTPTYPVSSPKVRLLEPKNILQSQLQKITERVDQLLKEYADYEVSFAVISEVKEMLDDHQQATGAVLSLEEEREQRLRNERLQLEEKEKRRADERKLAKQKQNAMLNEQILKIRGEYYEDEVSKSDDDQNDTNEFDKKAEDDLLIPDPATKANHFIFTNSMVGYTRSGRTFRFQAVLGFTPCESKGPFAQISTSKIVVPYLLEATWTRIVEEVLFILVEVTLENKHWKSELGKKQIQDLETELLKISNLAHESIYGLVGFQIDEGTLNNTEQGSSWNIKLLLNNRHLQYVDDILVNGPVSGSTARSWLMQLLPGLEYLHNLGISDKLIAHGGVVLCNSMLKFTHISYGYSILSMLKQYPNSVPSDITLTSSWSAPEFEETGPTLKSDIWDLGVLLLVLMFGNDILKKYPSPKEFRSSFRDDYAVSESVYDLFDRILLPKASRRPSPMELNAAKFMRDGLSIRSDPADSTMAGNGRRLSTHFYDSQFNSSTAGRYERDFEEVGKLGKGGFGEVVKARNRMEGTFYAVKKIKYKAHKLDLLLSEVLSLARLNHQYIVRYYGTWVEEDKAKFKQDGTKSEVETATNDTTEEFDDLDNLDFDDNSAFSDDPFTFSARNSSFLASLDNSFQVDFISNDPQIEFGYSSNEENEENESLSEIETSSGIGDSSISVKSKVGGGTKRKQVDETPLILYIQMEFCENNTLQNLIEQGLPDNPNEYWRLFRQLLEAVSYIHREGFIHRDLKPINIFIDKANNVKVGDFGLAKNSQFANIVLKDTNQVQPENKDWLTVVGTAFYTANEVTTGNYDEKVDMYSLGVIFFEMCYSMGTGMERAQTLNELRLASITFPQGWKAQNLPQKRIIKLLLDHDPSKRPGAAQILQSGWLPVEHQDQIIQEALKLLADPALPWQQQVRETLFRQAYVPARDLMFDVEEPRRFNHKSSSADDYLVCDTLLQKLTAVFRNHGAVEDCLSLQVLPKLPFYSGDNVFEVLDKSGSILQLPYDLTLPRARYLSKNQFPFHKSFKHGVVYRPGLRSGGKPDQYLALNFDILTNDAQSRLLHDAECLVVLDEIFSQIKCSKLSSMLIIINHSDIVNTVINFLFEHVGIDDRKRAEVLGILSQLGIEKDAEEVKTALRAARIPHTVTRELMDKFNFLVEPQEGILKFQRAMVDLPHFMKIEKTLQYINSVLGYFKRLGGKTKVLFSPLINYNTKYYRGGIMFQAVHQLKSSLISLRLQRRKARIASGGRFDLLIETLANRDIAKSSTSYSVGFQLSTTFLWLLLLKGLCQFNQTKGRCQVVIGSTLASHIIAGCEVAPLLWKHSILADVTIPVATQEDLYDDAKRDGVSYVILIRDSNTVTQKRAKKGGFKPLRLRNLHSNKDFDVDYDEVVSTIRREEALVSDISSDAYDMEIVKRHQSEEDLRLGPINQIDLEQRVYVVPNNAPRGRKSKKDMWETENDAQIASSSLIKQLASGPVILIDAREEVLAMILVTSLKQQDEWMRKVIYLTSNLPKSFATNIYNTLSKEAAKGTNWAILHSPKSDITTLVDLQR